MDQKQMSRAIRSYLLDFLGDAPPLGEVVVPGFGDDFDLLVPPLINMK